MPLVTIHTTTKEQSEAVTPALKDLREVLAKELSVSDRQLAKNEISIRVVRSNAAEAIAEIEVVVIAHSYKERIEKQDQICLNIKSYLEKQCAPYSFYVWLQLSELGHSQL